MGRRLDLLFNVSWDERAIGRRGIGEGVSVLWAKGAVFDRGGVIVKEEKMFVACKKGDAGFV